MASINFFQSYPKGTLLGQISRSAYVKLSDNWSVSEYQKGQAIMGDEESSTDICFLLTGSARVAVYTERGRQVSFVELTKGDCFGEFSAIDGEPRSASIEAVTTCVAARVSSAAFREVLIEAPDLSLAMLENLVLKLRRLTSKVSDFNTLSADERIRAEILKIAQENSNGRDKFVVLRPPTQVEIASQIFSNRETVAREMGRMRKKGLIGRDGRNLKICSLAALEEYVCSSGRFDKKNGSRELMTA